MTGQLLVRKVHERRRRLFFWHDRHRRSACSGLQRRSCLGEVDPLAVDALGYRNALSLSSLDCLNRIFLRDDRQRAAAFTCKMRHCRRFVVEGGEWVVVHIQRTPSKNNDVHGHGVKGIHSMSCQASSGAMSRLIKVEDPISAEMSALQPLQISLTISSIVKVFDS